MRYCEYKSVCKYYLIRGPTYVRKSTPARDLISDVCKAGIGISTMIVRDETRNTYVAERGTHDDRFVAVLLVIVEDTLN